MRTSLFGALALAVFGCGPTGADPPEAAGAPPGLGGASAGGAPSYPGAGGAPLPMGSGGGFVQNGAGGAFASAGGASAGPSCGAPVIDPTTLPACTTCAGGRCVASADYPSVPAGILDACSDSAVCLPDEIVATKGNVALARCTSVLGNEGRCASLCIPLVRSLSSVLPRDLCAENERCAPCFNPTDGGETGLCRLGCDPGPTTAGILFSPCCGGRGDCVPRADIPGPASSSLGRDSCATGTDDLVCVPSSIVKDPTYRFPGCTSQVNVPGVAPGPGVCVPDCVVNSNPLGKFLGAGTCTTPGDKCAPCSDPTGKPTGACVTP